MKKEIKLTVEEFEFNGYMATVIRPKTPNGKWIWKTEFLYAFDQAEIALCEKGFTRVYYCISDKYGSNNAVRLMHAFHLFVTEKYGLEKKANLFGFSRGGLYAFNYALFYPEYVSKVYLDAPVLDLKTWPPKDSMEQLQLFNEYGLNADALVSFKGNPVDNLSEFFALQIPLLIVAGAADEVVPFEFNAGKLIKYCNANNIKIISIIKPTCLHHPHSLVDVSPIVDFIKK